MGYVMVMSPCIGCGRPFSFNPTLVPSLTHEGTRRPICADCVARVNPMRAKNGLPLIVPHPDAYEPCDDALENMGNRPDGKSVRQALSETPNCDIRIVVGHRASEDGQQIFAEVKRTMKAE